MLILEEVLPKLTGGALWMPEQAAPSGARLICPDLDITVAFTSNNLVVDRNPVSEAECDFSQIVATIHSTLVGRFDLKSMSRFGARRIKRIPSEDVSHAEQLSTQFVAKWPEVSGSSLVPRSLDVAFNVETADRSKGLRIAIKPFQRFDAEIEINERLKQPPHLLPKGQREALLDQLRRQRTQKRDPVAGVAIDIDYYCVSPSRDLTPQAFLDEAWQEADQYEAALLKGL